MPTLVKYPVGLRPTTLDSKIKTRCPKCRSEQVRYSTSTSLTEKLMSTFGRTAVRCDSCYHRWQFWIAK
ncbi:MAG: hypothetical protein ABI972_05570 [Acidobacteriota bacterium]